MSEDNVLVMDAKPVVDSPPASLAYKLDWETTEIKLGNTENPGIETVRQFAPHIAAAQADTNKAAA